MNQEGSVENTEDLVMSEDCVSRYCIALGNFVFDLDIAKGFRVVMIDKSCIVNELMNIEITFLTIGAEKCPFFWVSGERGLIGILVFKAIFGQIEWMKKKMAEVVVDLDNLLLDFFFSHGTMIGVLVSGIFIPYKIYNQ